MLTAAPPPVAPKPSRVRTLDTGIVHEPPGRVPRRVVVGLGSDDGLVAPDPSFTCTLFRPDGRGRASYEVMVARLMEADVLTGATLSLVRPPGVVLVRRLERGFTCPIAFPFPFVPQAHVKGKAAAALALSPDGVHQWFEAARHVVRQSAEALHFEARWKTSRGEGYFFPEHLAWYGRDGRLLRDLP